MSNHVKATYHNGGLEFLEPIPDVGPGPVEVVVVFPQDPWEAILEDPTPRPRLRELADEIEREIARGEAEPLDLDRL